MYPFEYCEVRLWLAPPADPYRAEIHGFWKRIDGYSDSPARGSMDDGKRFLAAAVAGVADALTSFYARTAEDQGEQAR